MGDMIVLGVIYGLGCDIFLILLAKVFVLARVSMVMGSFYWANFGWGFLSLI